MTGVMKEVVGKRRYSARLKDRGSWFVLPGFGLIILYFWP